jgi:hypothetical protein
MFIVDIVEVGVVQNLECLQYASLSGWLTVNMIGPLGLHQFHLLVLD